MKIEIFSTFLGWILSTIVPVVHITVLWYFWSRYHFPVNRATCTCECWDNVFKGPYEFGVGTYKNFYFNATKNTLKIWLLICTGLILLYEISKHLTQLLLRGKLRFSMLFLFLISIYPHYYSWWTYINYMNDGFYDQWNHQLFFTVTEIVSTAFVVYLSNIHHEITQKKMLIITGISCIHLIAGGIDQFVYNIVFMQGASHQIVRDIGFMVPDILHIIIPLMEINDLRYMHLEKGLWYRDQHLVTDLIATSCFVCAGCYLVSQL